MKILVRSYKLVFIVASASMIMHGAYLPTCIYFPRQQLVSSRLLSSERDAQRCSGRPTLQPVQFSDTYSGARYYAHATNAHVARVAPAARTLRIIVLCVRTRFDTNTPPGVDATSQESFTENFSAMAVCELQYRPFVFALFTYVYTVPFRPCSVT